MLVRMRSSERLHGCHGIVRKGTCYGVQEDAFSITAAAKHENECVLSRDTSETVPTPLLKKTYEFCIAASCLVQKLQPAWARRSFCRRDGRHFGDAIRRMSGTDFARPKIDSTRRCPKLKWVLVPSLNGHRKDRVRSAESIDTVGRACFLNACLTLALSPCLNSRPSKRAPWKTMPVSFLRQTLPSHWNHAPVLRQ